MGLVSRPYFTFLPLKIIMGLLVLACFFPISFGDFGPIKEFLWIEWMAPLAVVLCFFANIRSGKKLYPDRLLISAIFVLLVWAAINYILNPVSAQGALGAGEQDRGLRGYYHIFIGVCVFFSATWFAQQDQADQIGASFLTILVVFSLCLGILRVISYVLDFDIPMIFGVFRFGVFDEKIQYAAHRIGGLSEAGDLGISALIALRYRKTWNLGIIVLFLAFLSLFLMGGGRSAAIGLFAGLIAYFLIVERQKFWWALVAGLAIVISLTWVVQYGEIGEQLYRLTALQGGFSVQDPGRAELFVQLWEIFADHPIWGKGIGHTYGIGSLNNIFADQLIGGGHGAYLSMLCTFGLGGMFFLAIMVFRPILTGYRYLSSGLIYSEPFNRCLVFITLFLTIRSIEYIAGGDGYSDMTLYLLAGSFAGLLSRKQQATHA